MSVWRWFQDHDGEEWGRFGKIRHRALGAHTPTAHSAAISRFPCLFGHFSPGVAPQILCQQVIWPGLGTLISVMVDMNHSRGGGRSLNTVDFSCPWGWWITGHWLNMGSWHFFFLKSTIILNSSFNIRKKEKTKLEWVRNFTNESKPETSKTSKDYYTHVVHKFSSIYNTMRFEVHIFE